MPCRVERMVKKSRRTRANEDNSSRIRRGWQHLRPRPRRKRTGTLSPLLKRTAMRDCSRTATAAWAASAGVSSPLSRVPSARADSGPLLSGTRLAATGASRSTPGFLQYNASDGAKLGGSPSSAISPPLPRIQVSSCCRSCWGWHRDSPGDIAFMSRGNLRHTLL